MEQMVKEIEDKDIIRPVVMEIRYRTLYIRGLKKDLVRRILKSYGVEVYGRDYQVMVEPEYASRYDFILEDCMQEIKTYLKTLSQKTGVEYVKS